MARHLEPKPEGVPAAVAVAVQLTEAPANRRDAKAAARQSRNQSCRRAGCRLQVESCRLASKALGQLATSNLQLATSSQPANNLDYCSAETDQPQSPANLSLKGDRYERPLLRLLLCTAIDQIVRSLRATTLRIRTAEYAEYAENSTVCVPPSAYFAYSAVSVAALPRWALRVSAVSLRVPRLNGHDFAGSLEPQTGRVSTRTPGVPVT
jgi:hypothetical protein